MKVKVNVIREIEVEIDNPAIIELDNWWRTHNHTDWMKDSPSELIETSMRAVEEAIGIPFGDDNAKETVVSVLAMDGEPILEW